MNSHCRGVLQYLLCEDLDSLEAQLLDFPDCLGMFCQISLSCGQFIEVPGHKLFRDGFGQFAIGLEEKVHFI